VFFGDLAPLAEPAVFAPHVSALRNVEWNVYAKRPFGGPQPVLEYLGLYTHRVAIANSRLVACEDGNVCFRWKDYRANNKSKVRIHASLPPARAAKRVSPHSPLRLPGERLPHRQACRHPCCPSNASASPGR
jgi:hypothetical protein